MKILIDECVPRPIIKLLKGHAARTAQEMGWGGISNCDLLRRAEAFFDLFVTADKNIGISKTLRAAKSPFSSFRPIIWRLSKLTPK